VSHRAADSPRSERDDACAALFPERRSAAHGAAKLLAAREQLRACMHACVCVCARTCACVHVYVGVCMCVCVCASSERGIGGHFYIYNRRACDQKPLEYTREQCARTPVHTGEAHCSTNQTARPGAGHSDTHPRVAISACSQDKQPVTSTNNCTRAVTRGPARRFAPIAAAANPRQSADATQRNPAPPPQPRPPEHHAAPGLGPSPRPARSGSRALRMCCGRMRSERQGVLRLRAECSTHGQFGFHWHTLWQLGLGCSCIRTLLTTYQSPETALHAAPLPRVGDTPRLPFSLRDSGVFHNLAWMHARMYRTRVHMPAASCTRTHACPLPVHTATAGPPLSYTLWVLEFVILVVLRVPVAVENGVIDELQVFLLPQRAQSLALPCGLRVSYVLSMHGVTWTTRSTRLRYC